MPARIFSAFVFSSISVLLLNAIISTTIVYLAAMLLFLPKNSLEKALLVVLAGAAIGAVQEIFFEVTFFFSWIAALLAFLWAIKSIYKIDYWRAVSLWVISIILPIGAALIIVPAIIAVLYSIAF